MGSIVDSLLSQKDQYGRTRRERHDPTNSFAPGELAAIVQFMELPISYWIDMIKTGRASKQDTKNWIEKIDAISPGYGELFLGSVMKDESDQLSESMRPPVNYKKVGKNIVPYIGDRNHSEKDYLPDDTKEVNSQEELEAFRKVQDAEYELKKAQLALKEAHEKK